MNEQREALVRMKVYFPNFCTFIITKKVKDLINFFHVSFISWSQGVPFIPLK